MTDPPVRRRWRTDLTTIAGGAAVLVASGVAARGPLTDAETQIFQGLNDLPEQMFPAIWPLMQYGTFITIPILSLVAVAFHR